MVGLIYLDELGASFPTEESKTGVLTEACVCGVHVVLLMVTQLFCSAFARLAAGSDGKTELA